VVNDRRSKPPADLGVAARAGKARRVDGRLREGEGVTRQWRRNPYDNKVIDHVLLDQKPWATVLAVTADGMVPAVREYKQGRDAVGIELPAGTPNYSSKTPEQVMHDQLLVESGYEAGEVIYLGMTWMATRNSRTHF